jgi:hypothetical protein
MNPAQPSKQSPTGTPSNLVQRRTQRRSKKPIPHLFSDSSSIDQVTKQQVHPATGTPSRLSPQRAQPSDN